MDFTVRTTCVGIIAMLLAGTSAPAVAQYSVRVTTRLGVVKEGLALGIKYKEGGFPGCLLSSFEATTPPAYVLIEKSDHIWVAVHLQTVSSLSLDATTCTAKLVDGSRLTTKRKPAWLTVDFGEGYMERDLFDFAVVEITEHSKTKRGAFTFFKHGREGPLWKLSLAGSEKTNHVVRLPHFSSYYRWSGTFKEWAGFNQYVEKPTYGWSADLTPSFGVQLGDETVLADTKDFRKIVISGGEEPQVRLVADSGHESSGGLTMNRKDFKQWALVCELANSPGCILIVVEPECSLQRLDVPGEAQEGITNNDDTVSEPESLLPKFSQPLRGSNSVRVRNPNDFAVVAGIRAGKNGLDVDVPANGVTTAHVPDGRYDIYFVYSNKPDALFQGDSFTLQSNGVEIQIVKVVGGNYGIRQVK